MKKILLPLLFFALAGVGCTPRADVSQSQTRTSEPEVNESQQDSQNEPGQGDTQVESVSTDEEKLQKEDMQETRRIHFSQFGPSWRFSAEIPTEWEVENVPSITSLNIYDPVYKATSAREQSQIFVRQFRADKFLTLSTVDILEQEEVRINEHATVRYRIVKKPGVADFLEQPQWRSVEHSLIDIRLQSAGQSLFYVFAYRPEVPVEQFEQFISSLQFDNDAEMFISPIDRPTERVTKKPFGLFVTPQDSPVSPERFFGYHTGVDFEVFEEEAGSPVFVSAFCSGPIKQHRSASGYGGLIVQECLFDAQPIVVIYGHVTDCAAGSGCVAAESGQYVVVGQKIAVLGAAGSDDTDGERKHLHFGIIQGKSVDIRGYVSREDQLNVWLDPLVTFPKVFK